MTVLGQAREYVCQSTACAWPAQLLDAEKATDGSDRQLGLADRRRDSLARSPRALGPVD